MVFKNNRYREKQAWHFVVLALLLATGNFVINTYPAFFAGSFYTIGAVTWFWIGMAVMVSHQLYAALIWRTQQKHQWLTALSPKYGYLAFVIDYSLFLLLRLGATVIVALANDFSVFIPPVLKYSALIIIVVAFTVCSYYLGRGVKFSRLFGYEYFYPGKVEHNDTIMLASKRKYFYAAFSLISFAPGLIFSSVASLLLAFFSLIAFIAYYYSTKSY